MVINHNVFLFPLGYNVLTHADLSTDKSLKQNQNCRSVNCFSFEANTVYGKLSNFFLKFYDFNTIKGNTVFASILQTNEQKCLFNTFQY